MRQQILYVKNASDIILIFLKHGNTTIIVLNNAIQNFYKITLYIKIYYILTAGHHLFCRFIAKSDNAFQHALLILNGIFISQLQGLFQLVYTQNMALFLNDFLRNNATMQQQCTERPKKFS